MCLLFSITFYLRLYNQWKFKMMRLIWIINWHERISDWLKKRSHVCLHRAPDDEWTTSSHSTNGVYRKLNRTAKFGYTRYTHTLAWMAHTPLLLTYFALCIKVLCKCSCDKCYSKHRPICWSRLLSASDNQK